MVAVNVHSAEHIHWRDIGRVSFRHRRYYTSDTKLGRIGTRDCSDRVPLSDKSDTSVILVPSNNRFDRDDGAIGFGKVRAGSMIDINELRPAQQAPRRGQPER